MRLNRFLAAAGLGSRRSCETLIREGTVTINGHVCQNLATEVSDTDFVKVGSRRIQPEKPLYILLHKPRGYLCTVSDTHDRPTVFDLLPGQWPRLFHVGRLDLDSEGLLILTNDGDLALHLTHPRFKIEKEYEILIDRTFDPVRDTPRLLRGVSTEYGRAKADSVRRIAPNILRIVLRQGLKRQIRTMLYKVGYEVERLIRIRIGPIRLDDLRPGEWRALTATEVKALRDGPKTVNIPATPVDTPPKPARPARPAPRRATPGSRPAFKGRRKGSAASAPKAGRRP